MSEAVVQHPHHRLRPQRRVRVEAPADEVAGVGPLLWGAHRAAVGKDEVELGICDAEPCLNEAGCTDLPEPPGPIMASARFSSPSRYSSMTASVSSRPTKCRQRSSRNLRCAFCSAPSFEVDFRVLLRRSRVPHPSRLPQRPSPARGDPGENQQPASLLRQRLSLRDELSQPERTGPLSDALLRDP